MRLLVDENVPRAVVSELEERGHDVALVEGPASDDRRVLREAAKDRRVLLTHDKDFGLIGLTGRRTFGVILIRMPGAPPGRIARRVAALLDAETDWTGKIAVVDEKRVRVRVLRR